MKISFVINEPVQDATGGYKMIYMYANSFAQFGHDVTIYYLCRNGRLFTNYKAPFFIKFVIAKCLANLGPRWFVLDKRIKRKAIRSISDKEIQNADVVIATAVNTAFPVSQLHNEKGKKAYFIQDFENWEISDDEVFKTYGLGMKNIVVSRWLKELVDKHSIRESVVVSNGINTDVFFDRQEKRSNHSIVVQYRQAAYKGPQYALEAINLLSKKFDDLKVYMISVDKKPESLPLCCEYYFSITPEEVAQINNKATVFMCTSVNEGYGLPGLEAMACGCVLCSSGYKGVYEYAVDGTNALISPIGNVDALVSNICKVFCDEMLVKKLKENAKRTCAGKSHDHMSKEFNDILIGLCEENN